MRILYENVGGNQRLISLYFGLGYMKYIHERKV